MKRSGMRELINLPCKIDPNESNFFSLRLLRRFFVEKNKILRKTSYFFADIDKITNFAKVIRIFFDFNNTLA